jgi:hypothetical protein
MNNKKLLKTLKGLAPGGVALTLGLLVQRKKEQRVFEEIEVAQDNCKKKRKVAEAVFGVIQNSPNANTEQKEEAKKLLEVMNKHCQQNPHTIKRGF